MQLNMTIRAERLLRALDRKERKTEADSRRAVEAICRQIVNYAKENGPWKDQTSNLRNSIDYIIDPTPGVIRGTVFAGMEYAIHVEKAGFWVLSGAVDWVRPILREIFRGQFRVG